MNCAICKSKKNELYKTVNEIDIYRCFRCDLAFVDPVTPRGKTSHIYSFSDYQSREGQFIKRYENTARLMNKYSQGKKVLEVGAGFGLLSSIVSRHGYDVDALEPEVEVRYVKNLPIKIYKKTLSEFVKETKNIYDAIIMYDVLEHVDDPNETIILVSKLLKKGGIVFIQTPNYQSLMAYVVRHWSWWMVEDHRFFFSRKSLYILFSKKVWNSLFYTTHEEWPDFKKNLDGNFTGINNGIVRKIMKGLFFVFFIPFYFCLRTFVWRWGRGGLHICIYQKK